MVTILFESVEEQKKRILPYKKFAITLRRIIQGSRIASEALTSFRDVVFEDGVIKKQAYGSEHQNLFLNFDALPGDCACQIRPAMLHAVVSFLYGRLDTSLRTFLSTLLQLRDLQRLAVELHERLCTHDEHPKALVNGTKNQLSLFEFYRQTGIHRWFDHLSDLDSPGYWTYASGFKIDPSQCCPRATSNLCETFRLSSFAFVVKLCVNLYLIGAFKVAVREPGKVIYRIDPSVRATELNAGGLHGIQRERFECYQVQAPKGSYKMFVESSSRVIKNDGTRHGDFSTVGVSFDDSSWVSHVSVSFISQILHCNDVILGGKGPDVFSDTLRLGIRNIALTPTYLTFLALRQFWADYDMNFFIIHKFIHDDMFHFNHYRYVRKCGPKNGSGSANFEYEGSYVPLDARISKFSDPHVCVVSESRPSSLQSTGCQRSKSIPHLIEHRDDTCLLNSQVKKQLSDLDLNKVLGSFFAQHDYPYFDASDSSTSNDGSLKKSFSAFGLDKEREEKDYLEQESDRLGTSPVTPDLITFKHVFYERPTRIIDMQVLHSKSDKEPVLFGFNEKTPKQTAIQ